MTIHRIDNHVTQAQDTLVSQFRQATTLHALVAAFASRMQVLEDALHALYTGRWLATSVNAQLTNIGKILTLPRYYANDERFRVWLAARIQALRTSGTITEIIQIFQALLPGVTPKVYESYPATFTLVLDDAQVLPTELEALVLFARQMKPAGVKMIMEYRTTLDTETFSFLDDDGLGFGDVNDAATGGTFAGARD